MDETLDTIVIGGSAGSLPALKTILPQLDRNIPASIIICQHYPVIAETRVADLLAPLSSLPVTVAQDGMPLEHGRVYFAAPDVHLMLGKSHIHLRRGAHENRFRPAIDPLFRSAAVFRSTRVAGVILSGLLDDGAAGARAIARTGGQIIVQAPETADFPDMPRAALRAVPGAKSVSVDDIASCLTKLAGSPVPAAEPIPRDIGLEVKIAGLEDASMEKESELGELSPYNCPDCNGVLWQIEDGPLTRFRCHTGHAYSMEALSVSQDEALNSSLFKSLRAHKGRVELLQQMARGTDNIKARDDYEKRAAQVQIDAERIEQILLQRRTS